MSYLHCILEIVTLTHSRISNVAALNMDDKGGILPLHLAPLPLSSANAPQIYNHGGDSSQWEVNEASHLSEARIEIKSQEALHNV